MKRYLALTMFIICLLTWMLISKCQAEDSIKQQNVMLLIDGSSYANHHWSGTSKIKRLRKALAESMVEVNKTPSWGYHMGVRIFGDTSDRSKKDCNDSRLAAKLDWFEPTLVGHIMEGLKPKGRNCFTNAVAETKQEFDAAKRGSDNYLVCIISGVDECAKEEFVTFRWITGAANLKASYIIGLNLEASYAKTLSEIYTQYPGKFINVKNPQELAPSITKVLNVYCRGLTDVTEKKDNDTDSTKPGEKKQ